jgi:tetratricopeptide (TPR) repeat protein
MGPAAREAIPALMAAGSSLSRIFAVSVQRTLSRIDPTASLEADTPLVVPADPDTLVEEKRPSQPALTIWTEAIKLDPEDGQAYRCRARVHRELGDLGRAVADATEAVRIDPDDAEAYLIRGQAHLDAKDLDRAIADFGETLRREPNRLHAYNQRATACKLRGDVDQAIADYTELLRLKPNSHQAYFNRSLAWKKKQAYDRVVADLQEALRLDPEYAVAHNNLACLRATCLGAAFRDGNSALAHAHKACQLSGWSRPIMLNTLAAAYAEVGQFAEAVHWQKQALARPERLTPTQVEEFTARLRLYQQGQPERLA